MSPIRRMPQLRYRTIWISDIHLGNRDCKAGFLLDFLRSTECAYLYLVGDIIDLWAMRRGLYWPSEHNEVIRTILEKAKNGTTVIYIPGNHDERFRDYAGVLFGNVEICMRRIHLTADGRRLLVLHGDEFDSVIRYSRLIAHLGDRAYQWLLKLNRLVNYVRHRFGFPYWSISAYLKHKVKNAVNIISDFEHAIARDAKRFDVDGLVCGHIHHAEISTINGVLYCNDGDWVESCTALVESHEGALQLVHWADERHTVKSIESAEHQETSRIA